jgi:DnaJ like chaperone protein
MVCSGEMSIWTTIERVTTSVAEGSSRVLAGAKDLLSIGREQGDGELPVAFTIAVVALSAKMAKADGVVAGVEVDAFHRAFHVPEAELAGVRRVFTMAQEDTAGYEGYATQIARLLSHRPALLTDVLDTLFHIATADRALHPAEDSFLATVARLFGLSDSEFRHHRAQYVHDVSSPYDVLGLHPSASDEAVKARHRKLVRENHPDLAIGRGLPQELIDVATRRLAAINDAYAIIARERRL